MTGGQPNPRDVTGMLDDLHAIQSLQRWLEPLALAALFVQAWAFVEVMRTDEGYGTAIVSALVAACLLVWSHRERRRSRRIEEELLPWLD